MTRGPQGRRATSCAACARRSAPARRGLGGSRPRGRAPAPEVRAAAGAAARSPGPRRRPPRPRTRPRSTSRGARSRRPPGPGRSSAAASSACWRPASRRRSPSTPARSSSTTRCSSSCEARFAATHRALRPHARAATAATSSEIDERHLILQEELRRPRARPGAPRSTSCSRSPSASRLSRWSSALADLARAARARSRSAWRAADEDRPRLRRADALRHGGRRDPRPRAARRTSRGAASGWTW